MVYTALSKKQYSYVEIYQKEGVLEYLNELTQSRQHMILYPVNTKQEISAISDLIDEKWKRSLLSEIADHKQKPLMVKQINGKVIKNVQFIEHVNGPVFRIRGKNGEISSFNFSLFF